jgi:hypothetical protein
MPKTSKKELKVTLLQYGLHVTGNRPSLIARLQEFAENKPAWISYANLSQLSGQLQNHV